MHSFKLKQYSTLIGSSLLHVMIGSIGSFANLNTYITSYLRINGSKDANYGESVWFIAIGVTVFTLFTIASGFVAKKIGTRTTQLIGTIIFCGSIGLTSLAVKHSFNAVLFTFGFLQNVGCGLIYTIIKVNCIKWFPANKGFVAGLITGANAGSSIFFTQIQTFYVNPNNLKPNYEGYFTEEELLSKVPDLFIVLSIIYGSIGLISICLIFNYPESKVDLNKNSDNSNESQENLILTVDNETKIRSLLGFNSNDSLREAMNTRDFYILLITFALGSQSPNFIGSMIKAFGQSFIYDDHYLAIILSLAFIVNAIGGVFWGKVLDFLSFKKTILYINGILAIFMCTLIFSSYYMQKILFTVWTFVLFFTGIGIFSCYLPEVVQRFGDTNATTLYGLIHLGPAIAHLITSPILEWMMNVFGWFTTFVTIGLLNAISVVIIMTYDNKPLTKLLVK